MSDRAKPHKVSKHTYIHGLSGQCSAVCVCVCVCERVSESRVEVGFRTGASAALFAARFSGDAETVAICTTLPFAEFSSRHLTVDSRGARARGCRSACDWRRSDAARIAVAAKVKPPKRGVPHSAGLPLPISDLMAISCRRTRVVCLLQFTHTSLCPIQTRDPPLSVRPHRSEFTTGLSVNPPNFRGSHPRASSA
jgi:hypothetical protein